MIGTYLSVGTQPWELVPKMRTLISNRDQQAFGRMIQHSDASSGQPPISPQPLELEDATQPALDLLRAMLDTDPS